MEERYWNDLTMVEKLANIGFVAVAISGGIAIVWVAVTLLTI